MRSPAQVDPAAEALFTGPGEMRVRCRALDWRATPLGSVETWPAALCAAVRLCLDCGFASSVQAGPDRVLIYNDAYSASLSDKHPWALGRPIREVWPEAVEQMTRNLAALLAGGPPVHHEDACFILERDGQREETFWTYALSLVRAEDGTVVGIITFGVETTARVRAEAARRSSEARRAFLLTLSDALRPVTDPAEIQTTASRLLGAHLGVSRAMYAEVDGEVDDEHGTIRGQYVHEGKPAPPRVAYGAFGRHLGERFRRGETLVVADVLTDPEYVPAERAAWLAAGARAVIGVALVKDGRLVANFGVLSAVARAWTPEEVALVRETAERTWEAAERARAEAARDRLLEAERRARAEADAARDRTERLQRLSAELTRSLTPDAVVDVVVRHLELALGAKTAAVFELSADARELLLLGMAGVDERTRERATRVPVDTPFPVGDVVRTRAAVFVENSAAWRAAHPEAVNAGDEIRAWAALPLRVEDGQEERLFGALAITFVGQRTFADEEVGFLQAFADLCAQALARARLLEAEHRRVEAEAARARAEAESRAKDDLLAVVSHELRAPLAPARALAQALARNEMPPSQAREMAAEIDGHIAYEARLIADLLDYQRASRDLVALQCQRCDVHEVARRALHLADPVLRAKHTAVTEEYAAADPVGWVDPFRVQQILYNLLANAAMYSPLNAPVVIRTRNPAPEWIEVAIVDTGFGIARDVLERLFEPFMQGIRRHGGPKARTGLGLGLALSRRLAELQGGILTADSDGPGRGATFTLRLPTAHVAEVVSAPADAPVAAVIDTNGDAKADRPLRILVIDDDASAARGLRRLLSLHGHVVHVAESLAAAEQIVGAEPLDVVLADLQLAEESGLTAPRRLAEVARLRGRPAPPAVVVSGYDRDSDVARSRAAGFVAHLAKPVEEQALLLAVRRAAGTSGQA
jgi:signal transduction histidine kinase/ActR/RegA family two-component response regulator